MKVPQLLRGGTETGPVVVGMVAAAVSGFLAIRLLLGYVRTRNYVPFALYRFGFTILVLAVYLWRRGPIG